MRLELEFQIKDEIMPLDYRKIFMSYLKKALTDYENAKYFAKYYSNTQEKDFNFSINLGKLKFEQDKILLEGNKIKMIVSTDDRQNTGFVLFNAFLNQKYKRFPLSDGNYITLNNIQILKQRIITSNRCIFKTVLGSSLCIREHNKETNFDKYYSINDKNFSEEVLKKLKEQAFRNNFSENDINSIQFKPLSCKKIVVKHYNCFIDTTVGAFELKANNMLLQYFYQNGLGSRRAESFGMIDLFAEEL